MSSSSWLRQQLQASADGFVWGAEQVLGARRHVQPPKGLGEWTATRHIFHLAYYEQTIALPSMRQWLGDPCPSIADGDEDRAWGVRQPDVGGLLADFMKVRADQIALLPVFDDTAWDAPREAVWGPVTLLWVVSKTYQHTAEHTSDIMRIALFWEAFADREQARAAG